MLVMLLATACQRQNEVELTLVAQKVSLETQIAEVRQTATVDSERLQITVEYMGTLVSRVEQQRFELQATQMERTQLPASDSAAQQAPIITPFPPPDGTINPDTETQINETPVPEVTVDNVPMLQDIVMAASVANNDCAATVTNSFTISSQQIYVVATANNITPGTEIAARFAIAGQEIRHDFTPDFEINGNCVWFYIDQSEVEFRAGNWSVQLELNGAPAGAAIPFTITES